MAGQPCFRFATWCAATATADLPTARRADTRWIRARKMPAKCAEDWPRVCGRFAAHYSTMSELRSQASVLPVLRNYFGPAFIFLLTRFYNCGICSDRIRTALPTAETTDRA